MNPLIMMGCMAASNSGFDVTQTLSGTYNKLELRDLFISQGWNGTAKLKGVVTLSGYCYSDDAEAYGLYIRNLSPGSDITLVITETGSVRGKGGDASTWWESPGERGGHALYVDNVGDTIIRIQNDGWIGGGGGGGGSAFGTNPYGVPPVVSGGGGGAGTSAGLGATGTSASGQNGTATAGGARGFVSSENRGGNGGGRGQAGQAGDSDDITGNHTQGGAAGMSVVGNNHVTWIKVGTLYGATWDI